MNQGAAHSTILQCDHGRTLEDHQLMKYIHHYLGKLNAEPDENACMNTVVGGVKEIMSQRG